jgi:hypothetical protein
MFTGRCMYPDLCTIVPKPADTLLGAGSFGRVYKGRWHSSDVAVKIITVRTPEELPKVLHEAEVMMQLDHPNVVRAFHASLWNPTEQVRMRRSYAPPCYSVRQSCLGFGQVRCSRWWVVAAARVWWWFFVSV